MTGVPGQKVGHPFCIRTSGQSLLARPTGGSGEGDGNPGGTQYHRLKLRTWEKQGKARFNGH